MLLKVWKKESLHTVEVGKNVATMEISVEGIFGYTPEGTLVRIDQQYWNTYVY